MNKGEKVLETMDENGVVNYVKFQMCEGSSGNKILGSVIRFVQAGHVVVFL